MSTEERIVAPQTKIGARPTGAGAAAASEQAPTKGGKKKLIMIIAIVGVVVLGAAYWFLLGPGKASAATTDGMEVEPTVSAEPEYELGDVLTIESVSINLQGGHYLRLGLGLQTIAAVHTAPDPAVALDAAIALYSGRTTEELADPAVREELKHELADELFHLYHEDVVDVYYTDFVTQ